MASFSSLDKRMMRDVNRIHDFLWRSHPKIDGEKLLSNLRGESRELDAFLGAKGKLRRQAEVIIQATAKDKDRYGAALYEFLYDTYNLTASTDHVRKKDYKGAAEHVAWVVESDSIGTCVALDRFSLVEEWEGGKIDFESYAGKLADILQGRGIAGAGQYKRMLLVARTFGKEWDPTAPRHQQALAARAAIETAAWCAIASRTIRAEAVRREPTVPLEEFSETVHRIVSRL